jgi:hypothetical protein
MPGTSGGEAMKITMQIMWRACLAISLVGFWAGCAMLPKEKLASSTTDYNLVVEKVQNEMLLLNVVRASKRRPMYFTGFNLLRGSLSYSFQTGAITIPFGKIGTGLNGAYSIAPSVSYSASPSFDLIVWDNKEFTAGIMTPVSMDTVYYYLVKLGWPKEMLLHLLVERIELYSNDKKLATYENDPENRKKFEEFQAKLRDLLKCRFVSRERSEPIGPRLQAKDIQDLKQLIEVQKAGLTLNSVTEGNIEWYQLSSKKTDYFYSCGAENESEVSTYHITDVKGQSLSGNENKQEYRIFLRSPEGILYYLGEILRSEVDKGYVPMIEVCESRPTVPLFVVSKSGGDDSLPIVSVDYEGTKYSIPGNLATDVDDGCRGDRSMQVLTFVSQLIAGQKAGMIAPVTGAVTAVGR